MVVMERGRDANPQISSVYHYVWLILIFQSREAAISFQLNPSIHLSEMKYVIRINSLPETMSKDLQTKNDNYKTDNVNVSHNGKYI